MRLISFLVSVALVAGCAPPSRSSSEPAPRWTLQGVKLVHEPSYLAVGKAAPVKVIGTYANEATAEITRHVVWESSDSTILDTSIPGYLLAKKPGVATITVKAGIFVDSSDIWVTDASLTRLEMSPSEATVPSGIAQRFSVQGYFSDGSRRDVTRQVRFSTDDPNIAEEVIQEAGLVHGKRTGKVGVTVHLDGHSTYSLLSVSDAVVEDIIVEGGDTPISAGSNSKFTAWGVFSDGTTQDLSSQVDWSVSNHFIATISPDGFLQGWLNGNVRVFAQLGNASGDTQAEVQGVALHHLEITTSAFEIAKGESVQIRAYGHYVDGSVRDLTGAVTWHSSNEMVFDPITIPGLGRTFSAGMSVVVVDFDQYTASKVIKVGPAKMIGLDVDIQDTRLTIGKSLQLRAFGKFTDGTYSEVTEKATWTCGTEDVLSLSNEQETKGLALALPHPGTASVSVSYKGFQANSSVRVTDAVLQAVTIQWSALATGMVGGTALEAIAEFSDGVIEDFTQRVFWSSSDATVATISNEYGTRGQVSVAGSGHVDFGASLEGITATYSATFP